MGACLLFICWRQPKGGAKDGEGQRKSEVSTRPEGLRAGQKAVSVVAFLLPLTAPLKESKNPPENGVESKLGAKTLRAEMTRK